MQTKIRNASDTVEDATIIKAIDAATFKDCPYTVTEIQNIIRSGKQAVLLAEINSKAVGFISLMEVQTLHYHGYWIDLLAVIPEYQGRGIGNCMIDAAHDYATCHKGEFVSALVRRDNTASLRSFEKSAFKNEGDFNLLIK